jgi:hypothetical protein
LWLMAREPNWRNGMSTRRWRIVVGAVPTMEGAGVNKGRDLACRGRRPEHGVVVLLLCGLVWTVAEVS